MSSSVSSSPLGSSEEQTSESLADWLVIVPARLASERLPRKPLADLGGLPMIVRVVQNLQPLAARGAVLVVATDSDEVKKVCAHHGISAEMTSAHHPSGTDRCWEVAARRPQPFIMNVQGDEPFVDTNDLERLAANLRTQSDADIGTLVYKANNSLLAADPNAVKAIRSTAGFALYFSRAAIPYDRDSQGKQHLPTEFWHHMGIYAFRRQRLAEFVQLTPSLLERTEKLEQLRALENGWRIHLTAAKSFSRGIDTPADLDAARMRIAGGGSHA